MLGVGKQTEDILFGEEKETDSYVHTCLLTVPLVCVYGVSGYLIFLNGYREGVRKVQREFVPIEVYEW